MCSSLCHIVEILEYESLCYCAKKDMSHSLYEWIVEIFCRHSGVVSGKLLVVVTFGVTMVVAKCCIQKPMFILLNQAKEILSCAAESALFKKPIKSTNSHIKSLCSIVFSVCSVCVNRSFRRHAHTYYLKYTLHTIPAQRRCFLMPPIVQMISLFYVHACMHSWVYKRLPQIHTLSLSVSHVIPRWFY